VLPAVPYVPRYITLLRYGKNVKIENENRVKIPYFTFVFLHMRANYPKKHSSVDQVLYYRQPGLLCTPQNFAKNLKKIKEKIFLVLRLPLRHF
jgi:hypothetical protein